MINAILQGVMYIVIQLSTILLLPIDLLISTFLPSVNTALSYVANLFTYLTTYIGFGIDILGLSSTAISLIIEFWVFKLTAPFAISAIKLAINWYKSLKL